MSKRVYPERYVCQCCGNATANRMYCNLQCQAQHRLDTKITLALDTGVVPDNYSQCKMMIAAVRGFKCEMTDCGITEWKNQPVLLILDHIDGNSSNHVWSNLRTVCSNCDAQLPTYKARNKNSARAYRRERYANGQTY